MNDFSSYSWEDMEHLTGKLFEKKGYEVRVTQKTGDSGIDVWAEKDEIKIGVQVKHWNADVGIVEVTQTLGAGMGKAHKCILISTKSFFTPQALEYQRQNSHHIELWDTNRFKKELLMNDLNISSNLPAYVRTKTIEQKKPDELPRAKTFRGLLTKEELEEWNKLPLRAKIFLGFLLVVIIIAASLSGWFDV